jgi:molecular chaperone GrpE
MTWRIYQHPSDSNGNDGKADIENGEKTESITSPMDPLAQLRTDVDKAKAEAAEWQDRFLRKAAELENFRKRSEKEKTDSLLLARSSVLIEFLPVVDACERALKMLEEDQNSHAGLEQYRQGVELLYKQLLDTLSRTGVEAMETEGKKFDPHRHEALSREETEEFEEGTVTKELRRGYLLKEKLLRPAQVVVAVRPQEKDQATK